MPPLLKVASHVVSFVCLFLLRDFLIFVQATGVAIMGAIQLMTMMGMEHTRVTTGMAMRAMRVDRREEHPGGEVIESPSFC